MLENMAPRKTVLRLYIYFVDLFLWKAQKKKRKKKKTMEGKLLKGLFPLKFKINLDRGLVRLMEKFHEPATFLPKSKQIKINRREPPRQTQ